MQPNAEYSYIYFCANTSRTMTEDLLYQVSLTLIPNVGAVQAKALLERFGSARSIFNASVKQLSTVENVGEIRALHIKSFSGFREAEAEIEQMQLNGVEPLFILDERYPKRLLNCYDSPTLLYWKGNTDLNSPRIISIIGTRSNTDYSRQVIEKLLEEIKEYSPLIVSGLAFGVDSLAHKTALQTGLPTVGVLGNGLQTVYPAHHKSLAKEMMSNGGLLSEFTFATKPDKHNFPKRNRIVAGISDATIVMETALRGGSMITAELANNYNRDVFALPGKTTDSKSAGCNYLIKNHKAILLTDGAQLAEELGWQTPQRSKKIQRELFIEVSNEEQAILDCLKQKETMHIDELYLQSGMSSSTVAAAILNLELQNVVMSLPGKIYKLA